MVDRNSDVFECVEELLKIKNLIAIKGNHDVWFQQFLDTDFHPLSWNHGGIATLESYIKHCQPSGKIIKTAKGFKSSLNAGDIPENHKNFFKNQKLYYVDDKNRCFVHAGFNPDIDFYTQDESNYYYNGSFWEILITNKENITKLLKNDFEEVYLGHTSTTKFGTDIPISRQNITNIDTGSGKDGRLTIMNVVTKQFWQSDNNQKIF